MQQEPSERTTWMPSLFVAGHDLNAEIDFDSSGTHLVGRLYIEGNDIYPPSTPAKIETVRVVDDFLYRLIGD